MTPETKAKIKYAMAMFNPIIDHDTSTPQQQAIIRPQYPHLNNEMGRRERYIQC